MSAAEVLRDQILAVCRATRNLDGVEIEWALTDALSATIICNALSEADATLRIADAARTMHDDARNFAPSRWRWPLKKIGPAS
jgi:hypothetical protein